MHETMLTHQRDPELTKRWRFEHDIVIDHYDDLLPVVTLGISELDEVGDRCLGCHDDIPTDRHPLEKPLR